MYEKLRKFIYAVISIIAGTLASILHDNGLISIITLYWVLGGCFILLVLFQAAIYIIRNRKKVNYNKFRKVIENNPEFKIFDSQMDAIRNMIQKYGRIKVIYQIKVKHHINWLDAIYWGFMRKLSAVGVDVTVLICDTEFFFDSKTNSIIAKPSNQYIADLNKMIAWIKKIASKKIKILLASEFNKNNSSDNNLVLLLYEVLFPYVVNNKKLFNSKDKCSSIQTYRYLLGLSMMCSEQYKGPILAMTWAGRQPLLESFILHCGLSDTIFPIVGSTYALEDGTPIKSDDECRIDVEETELREILRKTSQKHLDAIGKYVLDYPNGSNKSIGQMCKDLVNMRKKIRIKG